MWRSSWKGTCSVCEGRFDNATAHGVSSHSFEGKVQRFTRTKDPRPEVLERPRLMRTRISLLRTVARCTDLQKQAVKLDGLIHSSHKEIEGGAEDGGGGKVFAR